MRWSRDAKELFYVQEATLLAVSVSMEDGFVPGLPTPLFEHHGLRRPGRPHPVYDVSPDGRKFIFSEYEGYDDTQTAKPAIRVVQNWFAEFKGQRD